MTKLNYSEKFKELVLYVLSSKNYEDEGIKKLNKILYFIDFYYYRDNERFISEEIDYAKAERGPIVNDYKFIFKKLCEDKILECKNVGGMIVHKPLIKPDISKFSSKELEHIHDVLERYGKLSSAELESISHDQQPWVLTEVSGSIIDPDLALLMDDKSGDKSELINETVKDNLISIANEVEK